MKQSVKPKRWMWVVVGVTLPGVAVLIGLYVAAGLLSGGEGALLIGYDTLARVGEPATLRIKVQRGVVLQVVVGAEVTFRLPESEPRSAVTDADGVASIDVTWASAGRFIVPVVVRERAGLLRGDKSTELTVRLYVEPAETAMVVCDVDHTLADISALRVVQTPNEHTPVLPGSIEVLRRLAGTYAIVYLTARDDKLFNKTRVWLDLKGYPDGPLFARNPGSDAISAEAFKTEWLARFTADGSTVAYGFGDRVEDAAAYDAVGIRSYIVRDAPFLPGALPATARHAADWDAIKAYLFAEE